MDEQKRTRLHRLASNPHYVMGSHELKELEELQKEQYANRQHSTKVKKHQSAFRIHNTDLEKEDDNGKNATTR